MTGWVTRTSIGLALLGLSMTAGLARAEEPAEAPKEAQSCFLSSQWQGWKSPNENVIYLRVGVRDVYRVDLAYGSPMLKWHDSHLISRVRGSSWICSSLDLDLKVASYHGFAEPLFVKSITKLTRDEAAAIPPQFQP
jgi:hypothetical protein